MTTTDITLKTEFEGETVSVEIENGRLCLMLANGMAILPLEAIQWLQKALTRLEAHIQEEGQ